MNHNSCWLKKNIHITQVYVCVGLISAFWSFDFIDYDLTAAFRKRETSLQQKSDVTRDQSPDYSDEQRRVRDVFAVRESENV